nr:deoxyribodipyrimidine photo-lyase [Tanacetum cinerariifolium]
MADNHDGYGNFYHRLLNTVTLEADMARALSLDTGKAYKEMERLEKKGEEGLSSLMGWFFAGLKMFFQVDEAKKRDVAVEFNLFDRFLGAKARRLGFMIIGLKELSYEI